MSSRTISSHLTWTQTQLSTSFTTLPLRSVGPGLCAQPFSRRRAKNTADSSCSLDSGGPPALRAPEHLDGLPDLSPPDLMKVQDSKVSRGRDLFETVASRGGVATVEQPPGSMAWLVPDAMPTLKKFRCHVAWVDACVYDVPSEKFLGLCKHVGGHTLHSLPVHSHAHEHQSIRGAKDAKGGFLSSSSAEYPPALAQALASVPPCLRLSSPAWRTRPCPYKSGPAFSLSHCLGIVCDGAGRHSSADHTLPNPSSPLKELSTKLSH